MFQFGESTEKLEHIPTKENSVTLLFGAWLCYIYVYMYTCIYNLEYISMVM